MGEGEGEGEGGERVCTKVMVGVDEKFLSKSSALTITLSALCAAFKCRSEWQLANPLILEKRL